MFRHTVSSYFTGSIILTAFISFASSIPVSTYSRNIKCIVENTFTPSSHENYPRRCFTRTMESPGRKLFNLDESAIATLSKLANLRLINLAAIRQEQQRIPMHPGGVAPPEIEVQEPSLPMMTSQDHRIGGYAVPEKNGPVEAPEKSKFPPRKFHCHPIEDIYIPAVDKMVPAYICKLELRQFIISSDRFLEEYKHHLDVTVDETTFHRLLIPEKTSMGNSMANVIPVTLTQRQGDEFYGVKRT